ncbi:ABC-type nitrate/sulfonate/bicarbonate transport system, substrate-binding protein [Nocardiopsis flavescens]|uniref:ABC-type nitrate/sulfonate/bicarbonate transport system, substrate-binding protein n=1 Tax=Nocardiopsis flavescens TaxID=758803 RepID=A0A1M6HBE0_9ACTN|nr:ABC transporter substrate-binding protein [Nocardiopsis flavescens]SHJ19446.1 ABC-type nitrate/sulfonate/bicarbonate transport system, substrate-binding protein [Nocardiopsis flavescens]
MTTHVTEASEAAGVTPPPGVDRIWYTRCPVPTASGLALKLGWLTSAFNDHGLTVGVLQDAPPEIAAHHFDHRLRGLFREGGSVPALAARSEGAPTRLIGLTWIDEGQAVLTRPDTGITGPADLAGRRVAVPGHAATPGRSFPRAMALHGLTGALALAGLTLDDVQRVEVSAAFEPSVGADARGGDWPGLSALAAGEVDAVYVKGARAAEEGAAIGAVVAVDLDAAPDPRSRVNNGTPRPITVHERTLEENPELVTAFLVQTLRAADWAATRPEEVRAVLAAETRSGAAGVDRAYADGFHTGLAPDLSEGRLDLLDRQQRFLHDHGFLAAPVDVRAWAAHGPLAEAHRVLAREHPSLPENPTG